MIATRQLDPALTIRPLWSEGISPDRTSDDLPQPEVPIDRQKAAVPELPEQVVDLLLASEEQVVFVGLERTEPGEGIGLGRRRHSAQAPLAGSARPTRTAASASGARPSHWGSSSASCVRNCSFSGVRGPMRQMPTTGGGVVRP